MELYRSIGKEIVKIYGYSEKLGVAQSILVALLMLSAILAVAALVLYLYVRVHRQSKAWRTRLMALGAGLCALIGACMLVFPHLFCMFAGMADQTGDGGVLLFAFVVLIFVPMMLIGEYATDLLIILPTLTGPVLLIISAVLWTVAFKKSATPRVPESTNTPSE